VPELIDAYAAWVRQNPLLSAALQFALLGTLGELLPHWLRGRRLRLPCTRTQLLGKLLAWAVLGVFIKFGFTMMKGAARGLLEAGWLPQAFATGLGWALLVSVLTNLFFGPQMMFFHRLEDNLIARERNWSGLVTAWWTLIWFWIPAHTLTFWLPADYQIGLAALWSVVLGLILGLAKGR
jgi:hypothetical protein